MIYHISFIIIFASLSRYIFTKSFIEMFIQMIHLQISITIIYQSHARRTLTIQIVNESSLWPILKVLKIFSMCLSKFIFTKVVYQDFIQMIHLPTFVTKKLEIVLKNFNHTHQDLFDTKILNIFLLKVYFFKNCSSRCSYE